MPDLELEAMAAVASALGELDEGQQTRVLRWAADRYDVQLGTNGRGPRGQAATSGADFGDDEAEEEAERPSQAGGDPDSFEHFAELYDACNPSNPAERALVAAYWVQVIEGKTSWGSFAPNKLLKDLGHGNPAINKAFTSSMQKKPALVLQLKKTGKSQQGRKTYKLTGEGIKAVKAMMAS